MKSLKLTMLTLSSALCLTLGAFCMVDANVAKADNATGTTPVLSTTKVQISKNNDKMLLVTAIKDMTDVYEVGYTFTNDVETICEETSKYYTSIGDGTTTLTAGDIFDEAWTDGDDVGMIIWEVEFGFGTTYEYKAYAKVGERNEEGALVAPTTENVVTPANAISNTFYSATFKAEDEVVFSQIYNNVESLAEPEVPFKVGYVGAWEEYNPAAGNVTVNATYTAVDYTQYPIYKISADMDMRNDVCKVTLPEEVNGYQKIYAKLASYTANPNYETGATINEDGTLNVPKGAPNLGENLIRLFMYKDGTYATVEIALTKATMVISTYEDMQAFHDLWNSAALVSGYYVLGGNVDWGNKKWAPGYANSGKAFNGVLDGRGYKFAGYEAHYGLCQTVGGDATIKNVHFKPLIRGMGQGGGVCLQNKGTIENCVIEVTINSVEQELYSGITKNNEQGIIKNCIVILAGYKSVYKAKENMDAIAYSAAANSIQNCYAVTTLGSDAPVKMSAMYNQTVTDGLYNSVADFFEDVTALDKANGWSSFWKIENGGLYFKDTKVL